MVLLSGQAGVARWSENHYFPPATLAKFKKTFPELDVYENISFVHDGKAITSAGGAKSYDPALYLVEYLYGKKAADGVAGAWSSIGMWMK